MLVREPVVRRQDDFAARDAQHLVELVRETVVGARQAVLLHDDVERRVREGQLRRVAAEDDAHGARRVLAGAHEREARAFDIALEDRHAESRRRERRDRARQRGPEEEEVA